MLCVGGLLGARGLAPAPRCPAFDWRAPVGGLHPRLLLGSSLGSLRLHRGGGSARMRASRSRPRAVLAGPVAAAPAEPPSFAAWESKLANKFRRTDIKRILILGAGPIVIGQVRGNSAHMLPRAPRTLSSATACRLSIELPPLCLFVLFPFIIGDL